MKQQDGSAMTNGQTQPGAGLLRRMAALLYDAFLVAAIWMLLGFAVLLVFGTEGNQLVGGQVQTDTFVSWLLFFGMMASSFGFYAYFWIRSGQTLGMIAWRIKVVASDGSLINIKQALLRFLLAWPAFLLFFTGYLWALLDSRGDAIHDKLSGTRVILRPKSERPF